MPDASRSGAWQAIELAIRLATKACDDVRILAREGLRPGPPGLGFDDLSVEFDGERTVTLRFAREGQVKEFPIKFAGCMLYRGVYREGEAYEHGDTVTLGGSLWHCNADTREKPGEGKAMWTLAAKRGRDGRDGKDGEKGDRGPEGLRGKDLTSILPTGEKY